MAVGTAVESKVVVDMKAAVGKDHLEDMVEVAQAVH